MMSGSKAILYKSLLASGIICTIFGLMIPAILFVSSYGNMQGALEAEAEINARNVRNVIVNNPDMWQFEALRLETLLSQRPYEHIPEIRRVYDLKNNVVAESKDALSRPVINATEDIIDSGEVLGRIEITRSLRPLLWRTALYVILGLILSNLMYQLLPFVELARSTNELSKVNAFLSHILEASSNAIAVTDHAGNALMMNKYFEILTGCVQSEHLGQFICNHLQGNLQSLLEDYFLDIHNKQPKEEFNITLTKQDGQERYIQGVIEQISGYGDVKHIVISVIDVTDSKMQERERLEMERQFQQTQKLESLGVLAGGIAHDFNNILMIIMGNCTLARMEPETFESSLTAIEKASEHAATLCRQMLEYAGHTQFVKCQVDMEILVTDMVDMLSLKGQKNITIKPIIAPNVPFVHGDSGQISQIVMNLIVNATDAIGEKQGEIDVMLTKTTINNDQSERDHLGAIIPAGHYVCLEVTDNGCGMDDEVKRRMFEPFYTTKFTGRGLGLSATLGIISGHDGAIQLFSQPGKGTTFKVYLPAESKELVEDGEHQSDPTAPWQGSGTVLLVEDEDQVRKIATIILEKFGFSVIEAANGKEALELYQQDPAKIRLVITDIGMPIMDGYEFFFELKKLNPDLPIIVSSGFGDKSVTSKIPRKDLAGLISKPYNLAKLQELLIRVLESSTDRIV